jgi:hypothetical protein
MMGNGNADSKSGAYGRRTRTGLHAFLLACVAGLGIAVALGGPIAYRELTTSAETVPLESPAMAARPHATAGVPAGFADLVAKVRPSVISVRVKIESSAVQSRDDGDDGAAPSMDPNGMPRGRQGTLALELRTATPAKTIMVLRNISLLFRRAFIALLCSPSCSNLIVEPETTLWVLLRMDRSCRRSQTSNGPR